MGTQVIIPYRDEDEARLFKPMGDLGQIVRMASAHLADYRLGLYRYSVKNRNGTFETRIRSQSVLGILTLSTILLAGITRPSMFTLFLVGRTAHHHASRNFDYSSVHVEGAERIAKVAAASGVSRLVHVSHLNASSTSPSKFYQTKAEGEERVRAAFPAATVVRPGTMFGYEDKLLTNIASSSRSLAYPESPSSGYFPIVWPIWWKLNHGETQIRPVHVSLRVMCRLRLRRLGHFRSWMLLKPSRTSCLFLNFLERFLCLALLH